MGARLDVKKWIYASIAVFVVYVIIEYLSNQFVFMPSYPNMYPSAPDGGSVWIPRIWMYLGRAIFSFMFVFVYTRGYEGKAGIGEGLRYGLWIALLVPVPLFFRSLVASGLAPALLVTGMAMSVVEILILGVLTGMIYKLPAQKPAA
jgi:hypothetical protein